MSTQFPASLDTFVNPAATDKVSVVDHAGQHANENDAIAALETKVGVNGSAVTTTHDYKLSGVTGSDKAASKAGTETLTNKTLVSPTTTGTDAGTETLQNKTINGANNTLTVRLASDVTGNLPIANLASGSGASSSTFLRGDNTWATPGGGSFSQSNVVGSRAINTVYQNTSGKTMYVTATIGTVSGGNSRINMTIGATSSPVTKYSGVSSPNSSSNADPITVTAMVPNNWYYEFNVQNGTDSTLQAWWEAILPF